MLSGFVGKFFRDDDDYDDDDCLWRRFRGVRVDTTTTTSDNKPTATKCYWNIYCRALNYVVTIIPTFWVETGRERSRATCVWYAPWKRVVGMRKHNNCVVVCTEKDAIVIAKYSDGGDYGAMGGWMCVFFFSLYLSRLIKRRWYTDTAADCSDTHTSHNNQADGHAGWGGVGDIGGGGEPMTTTLEKIWPTDTTALFRVSCT